MTVSSSLVISSGQALQAGLELFTSTFVPLRSDQDPKTARNGCNISLQESTGCPFFLIVTAGELKRESDFFIHTRIPRYSAAAHLHITYQPMSSTLCQLGQQPAVTERFLALRPFVCSATISISNS